MVSIQHRQGKNRTTGRHVSASPVRSRAMGAELDSRNRPVAYRKCRSHFSPLSSHHRCRVLVKAEVTNAKQQAPIPLSTNRMRRFSNPRSSQLRHELEQGHPSPCAFGLVLPPRCARACCLSRYWMFTERRMGTPARSASSMPDKSDQPTWKAPLPS